jgi:hypothetical protein
MSTIRVLYIPAANAFACDGKPEVCRLEYTDPETQKEYYLLAFQGGKEVRLTAEALEGLRKQKHPRYTHAETTGPTGKLVEV